MNHILTQIDDLKTELLRIKSDTIKELNKIEHIPDISGKNLHVIKNKESWQYYIVDVLSHKETYIPKAEQKTAKLIAQRDYDKIVKKNVTQWIKKLSQIESLLQSIPNENAAALHKKEFLHPARAGLITPKKLSDSEYASHWQSQPYTKKEVLPGTITYETERGEKVRSKSEKIIADKLAVLGIPYRYEQGMTMSSGIILYPDFTILNPITRCEITLEHFGMIDKPSYADIAAKKVNLYLESGLKLNRNFFFTFETQNIPLNSASLQSVIDSILLE